MGVTDRSSAFRSSLHLHFPGSSWGHFGAKLHHFANIRRVILALAALLATPKLIAGVLPEDRADAMYHSYDGGGVEVTGPSYLVRKGDNKSVSGSINYYIDSISSASIDVLTQGSPYSEQRTQWSGNIDYLHADTTMNASYSYSSESDYKADTYSFSISQSLFATLPRSQSAIRVAMMMSSTTLIRRSRKVPIIRTTTYRYRRC